MYTCDGLIKYMQENKPEKLSLVAKIGFKIKNEIECQSQSSPNLVMILTHWGRVTHICVGKLITTGSDNGLSPDRRQAIIWTKAGILLIGPLGTHFSEILVEF